MKDKRAEYVSMQQRICFQTFRLVLKWTVLDKKLETSFSICNQHGRVGDVLMEHAQGQGRGNMRHGMRAVCAHRIVYILGVHIHATDDVWRG